MDQTFLNEFDKPAVVVSKKKSTLKAYDDERKMFINFEISWFSFERNIIEWKSKNNKCLKDQLEENELKRKI